MKKKKCKIRVYLKSGNHMDVVCKEATFKKNPEGSGYISYEFIKPKDMLGICPNQIEAWQSI
jgi:hypothetical protein